MSEELRNNAETTLNGAINSSVTSLTVVSATLFPTTGNFRIRIDNEIMLVTSVASSVFTVTRGIESTTAASHSSGADVALVVTTLGLDTYRQNFLIRDTLPAAGIAGRLCQPPDSLMIFRDNGTSWDGFGPVYNSFVKPNLTDYTWVNQGSNATATDIPTGIIIADPVSAGQFDLRCLARNRLGTSTGYKLTVAFTPHFPPGSGVGCGMGLFNSTTLKTEYVRLFNEGSDLRLQTVFITNPHNGAADGLSLAAVQIMGAIPPVHWLQVEQLATQWRWRYSYSGIMWTDLHDHTMTDGFGSGANLPDQFILFFDPRFDGGGVTFHHVKEET